MESCFVRGLRDVRFEQSILSKPVPLNETRSTWKKRENLSVFSLEGAEISLVPEQGLCTCTLVFTHTHNARSLG